MQLSHRKSAINNIQDTFVYAVQNSVPNVKPWLSLNLVWNPFKRQYPNFVLKSR